MEKELNARMRCGKSPKLDKCNKTAEGHIEYFQRVQNCNPQKTSEQTKKIISKPTEKRQKMVVSDKGADRRSLYSNKVNL